MPAQLARPISENSTKLNTMTLDRMTVSGIAYLHSTMLPSAVGVNLNGAASGFIMSAATMMTTASSNSNTCTWMKLIGSSISKNMGRPHMSMKYVTPWTHIAIFGPIGGMRFENMPMSTIAMIGMLKNPVNSRMTVHRPSGALSSIGAMKNVTSDRTTPNHWLMRIICLSDAFLLISTLYIS